MEKSRYLFRESVVSAFINALISALFFFGVFAGVDPVPVWGSDGYALDFMPQSFAVALMSALVPGFLARKALGAQRFGAVPTPGARRILVRAFAWAFAGLIAGAGLAAIALYLSGMEFVAAAPAFAIKVAYGALLGAIVTHRSVAGLLPSATSSH